MEAIVLSWSCREELPQYKMQRGLTATIRSQSNGDIAISVRTVINPMLGAANQTQFYEVRTVTVRQDNRVSIKKASNNPLDRIFSTKDKEIKLAGAWNVFKELIDNLSARDEALGLGGKLEEKSVNHCAGMFAHFSIGGAFQKLLKETQVRGR